MSLPRSIRALLGAIGVEGTRASKAGAADSTGATGASGASGAGNTSGAALASYSLFESEYTRELIVLGIADTMAKKGEVLRFLGAAALAQPARTSRD